MDILNYLHRHHPRLWLLTRFIKYRYLKGEHEIRVLRHLVPPARLAIDVGSSFGFYSYELAGLAPKVVAFEANPEIAAFVRKTARRNVEVINVALSSANGMAVLRTPISGKGRPITELATIDSERNLRDRHSAIEVAMQRLDDFGFTDCGFIKIDVEAHEEAVLEGGWGLISSCRPVLMIELDDGLSPGGRDRVAARLSQLSYDGYFLSRGELRPLPEFDPSRQQNMNAYLALSPRQRRNAEYINNFFFLPREMPLPRMARRAAR